ncbi:Mevalonate kinase [Diplonema papillatum]|nr:Mevalonate kinase [Diplonema papillatum]
MSNRAAVLQSHLGRQQVRDAMGAGAFIGYGKVILFGEHFVVYGLPALVSAVKEYTDCQIEHVPGSVGWMVEDNRPAVPGYKGSKRAEQEQAHDLVVKHFNLDLTEGRGVRITLGGPLVPTSGIGASASNVTALARAISYAWDLNLNDEEINAAAFEGEKGYHGTPSGIDNTAATYGGLLSYSRTANGPKFTPVKVRSEAFLVVVSTGITASTVDVVADVRRRKNESQKWFEDLCASYERVYLDAVDALEADDWAAVGRLMNQNHEFCRQLNLLIPELDDIVYASRWAGAAGAKMSGTGRGGIAVALCLTKQSQAGVAEALKNVPAAKYVWQYSIGG